jgi:YfiH family protein
VEQPDWLLRSASGVEYYEYAPDPGLVLAFFTRRGGASRGECESLNLSYDVGDKTYHVEENYSRVRKTLGLPAIVTMRQVHGDTVVPITYEKTPPELIEGDACYTDRPDLGLGIKVADCLPVYVYAADRRCIGIAHCGWRSTVSRVAEKLTRQMSRRFSLQLPELRFALGPCICADCYVVGQDVRTRFAEFPAADRFFSELPPARNKPRFNLDLRAANRWLLKEMGLVEVRSLGLCTKETQALFYSARRTPKTGRNLALVALRRPQHA